MADLRLEFGVLGGNKLAGESGHNILNDLQTICSNISRSKLLKVSVHLDNKTKFKGLQEEIESIKLDSLKLNTEKIKLKFGIDEQHLKELLNPLRLKILSLLNRIYLNHFLLLLVIHQD